MARFSGLVGYGQQVETVPGVWEDVIKERFMRGSYIGQNVNNKDSGVNDEIDFNHRISLVGDAYAFDNYFNMKWIHVDGAKWSISSVQLQRPRLIVSLGGIYRGD